VTEREELVQALREAMAALDACLNSADFASALEEADRVLTTFRPLLKRLAAVPTTTERRST